VRAVSLRELVSTLPGWTLVIRSRRKLCHDELSSQTSQALPWLWRSGGAAEILSDLAEHHVAVISCESEEEARRLAGEVRGWKIMVNVQSPGR
jgi:hypothetical protein